MQVEMKIELHLTKIGYQRFEFNNDQEYDPESLRDMVTEALEKLTGMIDTYQKFVIIIKTED